VELDKQKLDGKDYCCKNLAHDFVIGTPTCYSLGISIEKQKNQKGKESIKS
jgi:hypothetical protein